MDIVFIQKASHLAEVNKWTSLEELCRDKLEVNPQEEYAIYYLCLSYQARGKLNQALEIIEPHYTTSSDFESLYADICLQLKRYKVAESIYEKQLANNPQSDFNLSKLAKSKLGLLQYKKAREISLDCLKLNPNNEEAIKVYYLAGNFVKDEDLSYQSMIEVNPNNPTLVIKHVEYLTKSGRAEEAYEMASNCLTLNPNNELLIDSLKGVLMSRHKIYNHLNSFYDNHAKKLFIVFVVFIPIALILISLAEMESFYSMLVFYFVIATLSIILIKEPISNIILSRHPIGNLIMSKEEKVSVPIIIALFSVSVLLIITALLNKNLVMLRIGFLSYFSTMPVYSITGTDQSFSKKLLLIFISLLGISLVAIHFGNGIITYFTYLLFLLFGFFIYLLFMINISLEKQAAENEIKNIEEDNDKLEIILEKFQMYVKEKFGISIPNILLNPTLLFIGFLFALVAIKYLRHKLNM